jgi:hypothetical protein
MSLFVLKNLPSVKMRQSLTTKTQLELNQEGDPTAEIQQHPRNGNMGWKK